jgi:hypothetical protein
MNNLTGILMTSSMIIKQRQAKLYAGVISLMEFRDFKLYFIKISSTGTDIDINLNVFVKAKLTKQKYLWGKYACVGIHSEYPTAEKNPYLDMIHTDEIKLNNTATIKYEVV